MSVLRLVREKYKSAISPTDKADKRASGSNGGPCYEELKVEFPDLEPHEVPVVLEMLQVQEMRQQGVVPSHYNDVTSCARCGPVPIWEGCPTKVLGCPWCFNRHKGLPMPRICKADQEAMAGASHDDG